MLRIAYDVVKPILSFHVCTEAEKYFQTPWHSGYCRIWPWSFYSSWENDYAKRNIPSLHSSC